MSHEPQSIETGIQADVGRSQVNRLEGVMLAMPQVDLAVVHHFSERVYARELHIPGGTTLTGKIHKFANLNILSKGEISVLTESGVRRVKAPFTIVSPAGTKRAAYAHEDCVWTTIHGTDSKDIEEIEHEFIAESEQDYLAFCAALKLGEH